ncbi:hypothetical protein HDV01_006141 [Terramyces sp. JEL0728]|nr:hypothetical protein HDV01_006141 [Terramyces sp. JEL0728]
MDVKTEPAQSSNKKETNEKNSSQYADEFEQDISGTVEMGNHQHNAIPESTSNESRKENTTARPFSAKNSKTNLKENTLSATNLDKSLASKKSSSNNLKNANSLNDLNTAKKSNDSSLTRQAGSEGKLKDSQALASSKKSLSKDIGNNNSSSADLIRAQKVTLPSSAPMSREGSNQNLSRPKPESNRTSRTNSKSKVANEFENGSKISKKESLGNLSKPTSKSATPKNSNYDLSRAKDIPLPGSAPLSRHGSTTLHGVKEEIDASDELGSKDIIYSSVGQGEDDLELPQNENKAVGENNIDVNKSRSNFGSMDIIRSSMEGESDKSEIERDGQVSAEGTANPTQAKNTENKNEDSKLVTNVPLEPVHTPDQLHSEGETHHIVPKPIRNVLELNDSTVGRSRSVRSSISRKPMKGIAE